MLYDIIGWTLLTLWVAAVLFCFFGTRIFIAVMLRGMDSIEKLVALKAEIERIIESGLSFEHGS